MESSAWRIFKVAADMLRSLAAVFEELARSSGYNAPAVAGTIWFGRPTNAQGVEMASILGSDQKAPASVNFTDARGNPARVDGVPEWSSSDPAILEVIGSSDGLTGTVRAVGPLGVAQVQVKADADMGEGTRAIVLTGDVEVIAGEAVAGTVSIGAAEPQ